MTSRAAPELTPTGDDVAGAAGHASTRSATVWSYGLTLGKMGITTGLTLVLAAMLGPRAFGVIAIALVYINLVEMLQQQGLMPAIITRQLLRDDHADTAFWLVMGTGALMVGAGVLLAPLWAAANGLPELTAVIQVLAIGVPFTSSVVVHEAVLRRRLDFRSLAIRTWVAALAGGAAGITAAIAGWGVWALVAQQLTMSVTEAVVLWRVTSWRPRWQFSLTAARELWSYSLRSASSSVGLFLGGRVDVILAGIFFNPVVVGLYRMAHRLTALVVDVTVRAMQGVSLPALAEVQNEPGVFRARLLRMQRQTAALALPALGLIVGVAPVVELALGSQWSGTAPAIRILAIGNVFFAVSLLLGPALQALGRPGTLSIIVWVWAATGSTSLLVVGGMGIDDATTQLVALCVAVVVPTALSAVVTVIVLSRIAAVGLTHILRAWGPGLGAGLAASAVSWLVMSTDFWWPLRTLTAVALAGACAVAILAFYDTTIRSMLMGHIARRSDAESPEHKHHTDGSDK